MDPRAEWKQMYHEVWRIEREFFYDPNYHGLDLEAAEQRYAPYVENLDGLQPELGWEPEVALIGTGAHEQLARAADARFIAFEVGDGQAEAVGEILLTAGWRDVRITPDLAGTDRIVEGAK